MPILPRKDLYKLLKDPGFVFLLIMNGFLIYYYLQHPGEFNTIVWIYWLQSVLIGLFTSIELGLIKNPDTTSLKLNNEPISKNNMGCAALFFLFHYGFFHFVYAIFLFAGYSGNVNKKAVLLSGGMFFMESTVRFFRNRIIISEQKINVGRMFATPYARIIPMHLMILLPAFLGLTSSVVFLVLKTIADAGMYLLTANTNKSRELL